MVSLSARSTMMCHSCCFYSNKFFFHSFLVAPASSCLFIIATVDLSTDEEFAAVLCRLPLLIVRTFTDNSSIISAYGRMGMEEDYDV